MAREWIRCSESFQGFSDTDRTSTAKKRKRSSQGRLPTCHQTFVDSRGDVEEISWTSSEDESDRSLNIGLSQKRKRSTAQSLHAQGHR